MVPMTMIAYFRCLLCLCSVLWVGAATPSWRHGNIGALVKKDKTPLERTHGAVSQLRQLVENEGISQACFQEELGHHLATVSAFLSHTIASEEELDEVLEFFVSTNQAYSKAANSKGIYTLTNVLAILAACVMVLSTAAVVVVHIYPLLKNMSQNVKLLLAYSACVPILAAAKMYCGIGSQPYVVFIGAFAFAGAYKYHLSLHNPHAPVALVLAPLLLAWGTIAIYFETQLTGFLAVAVLETMMGFSVWSGPLCKSIGFQDDETIIPALISSGALVAFYITHALKLMMLPAYVSACISIFEPGILFLGTFVFYTALLILSSSYYTGRRNRLIFNILALGVGLASFYLGSLVPELALFRGVASTFFVLFLMEKYIEIPWTKDTWMLGLLGGSLLLLALCFFIESNPQLIL